MPSPRSVLVRPGSAMKFLLQVAPIAQMSPMCSTIAASATMTNVMMAGSASVQVKVPSMIGFSGQYSQK